MKVVLSIAGGGMRGVIPARVLVEIERRTGLRIAESFDLIAGTSTGGILGCLAASPKHLTAAEAMAFYYESGPRIFKPTARNLWGLPILGQIYGGGVATKYGQENLARELKNCIGDFALEKAETNLMVTAMESHKQAAMVKSWEAEWKTLPIATAALMTSAAQTYFPQAEISRGGKVEKYLDGGNVRNSPMACAAFEAGALWGMREDLTVIHLGTGRVRDPKPLPNGGAAFWASEIFDCTTNGDDSYDDYFCRGLEKFIPGFHYYRLDVDLEAYPAMDDASERTLDGLVEETERMLAREWVTLEAICRTINAAHQPKFKL